MKVDHADNQIFRWNPKATSLALYARVCFLGFSSPCVKGSFICRVVFKSQVKPLLKARACIQPREDMKIKTDQSLNVQQPIWVWKARQCFNASTSSTGRHGWHGGRGRVDEVYDNLSVQYTMIHTIFVIYVRHRSSVHLTLKCWNPFAAILKFLLSRGIENTSWSKNWQQWSASVLLGRVRVVEPITKLFSG